MPSPAGWPTHSMTVSDLTSQTGARMPHFFNEDDMKIKVQARNLQRGDVLTGNGAVVCSVSAGIRTPARKVEVTHEKRGHKRTDIWGAYTEITVERADKKADGVCSCGFLSSACGYPGCAAGAHDGHDQPTMTQRMLSAERSERSERGD